MNYRKWCERARKFVYNLAKWRREVCRDNPSSTPLEFDPPEAKATVEAPLTSLGLKHLQKRLRLPLPPPAQAFLLKGSRRCYLHYLWDPPKGRSVLCDVTICDAREMVQWQEMCEEFATDSGLVDFPEIQETWLNAVPFARMDADFLAFDPREDPVNPPVVSLTHDAITLLLAPNLDQFLEDWQQLCYIRPDYYSVKQYWTRKTGYLNPKSEKASKLRKLFGLKK